MAGATQGEERGQEVPEEVVYRGPTDAIINLIPVPGMSTDFYTYAYLREDRTPYYIGKGKGGRAFRKSRIVRPPKDKSRILILKKNLNEQQAFEHEIYMIFVFGRKDLGTGVLHNRTNGGDGSSGAIRSQEFKQNARAFWKGRKRPGQGEKTRAAQLGTKRNPWTPEQKEKLKGRPSPMKGRTMPEESKQKVSQSKKGKPWTEARRQAQINRKTK